MIEAAAAADLRGQEKPTQRFSRTALAKRS